MKLFVRFFLRYASVMLLSCVALGQPSTNTQSSEQASSPPVFRAQARLVIVDVIVTDKSAKAVTGLKASNFQLSENGVQQEVRVFEEHSVVAFSPRPTPLALPPNQYTNFPIDPPKNSVNLLLFDLLNTPAADQQWARQRMLKALQNLPPGQQVALFALGSGLRMIQGVSSDSDTLVKAANSILAEPNSLTGSLRQHQDDVDRLNRLAAFNREFTGGTNNDPAYFVGPSSSGRMQARLMLALSEVENAATDQRVALTLQALQAIGQTMSAYPGRKNLIWITGGIPFQILPNMQLDIGHRMYGSRDYTREVERTAAVLADNQIAIYPLDVKGLPTVGLTAEDVAQGAGDISSTVVRDTHVDQTFAVWDSHNAMKNLAHETGGRAFTGSNDLSTAIGESMLEGSHYYTLAYVPTNRKYDGLYRVIKVTSERDGLELAYRRGYFATGDAANSGDDAAKTLAAALQPGMPPATSILMRARISPPDASHKSARIDYAVKTNNVSLQETPDHAKHFTLDFMAVAWDSEGRVAASASDTLSPYLKPEFNMASLNAGIPANQELTLKPGKYVLSLGVMDRNTRAIGTVWASLTVADVAQTN